MSSTDQIVEAFRAASKLDINQAKTLTYWHLGTPQIMAETTTHYPALGLIGSAGSGKSTIEGGIVKLNPNACYTFSCMGVTPAVTRDELVAAVNKVAVIEEFDGVTDLRAASRFLQARCYRDTATIQYKEPLEKGGYRPKSINLWGATIYHMRNAPSDPALVSRSILLRTRHEQGPFEKFKLTEDDFFRIYSGLDWGITDTGLILSGRVFDTWEPVLRIGNVVGDKEWLSWAENQIKMLQLRLQEAAEYDYKQAILSRVIQVIAERSASERWDRIGVDDAIGQPLRRDTLPNISAWEVADTVKELRFNTGRKGGRLWLYPTAISVILACQETRYEDEWVDDLAEQLNLHASNLGD